MFAIIKTIIWIAGVLVIGYFIAEKLGYQVNMNYFSDSKEACQQKINDCSKTVLHQGIDNADQCDFKCVDPQLIIQKK
jgi:hypothetical protein